MTRRPENRRPPRRRSPWRLRWTDTFSVVGLLGYVSQIVDKSATGRASDQWIVFGGILLALAAQSPRVVDLVQEAARKRLERMTR